MIYSDIQLFIDEMCQFVHLFLKF